MHFVPSPGRTARLLLPCCSKWESILLVYADPIDLATSTASNEWSSPGMPCDNCGYLMTMNAPWLWRGHVQIKQDQCGTVYPAGITTNSQSRYQPPGMLHSCERQQYWQYTCRSSTAKCLQGLISLLGASINPTQPFRWSTSKCLIGFHISTLNTRDNTG